MRPLRKINIELLLYLSLISLSLLLGLVSFYANWNSIQLYDTYFVFTPFQFALILIGPIHFFTFLIRASLLRFQSPASNIGLSIGLILLIFITLELLHFFKGAFVEGIKLDTEDPQYVEETAAKAHYIILTIQGFLLLWIIGLVLLLWRTIKALGIRKTGDQKP